MQSMEKGRTRTRMEQIIKELIQSSNGMMQSVKQMDRAMKSLHGNLEFMKSDINFLKVKVLQKEVDMSSDQIEKQYIEEEVQSVKKNVKSMDKEAHFIKGEMNSFKREMHSMGRGMLSIKSTLQSSKSMENAMHEVQNGCPNDHQNGDPSVVGDQEDVVTLRDVGSKDSRNEFNVIDKCDKVEDVDEEQNIDREILQIIEDVAQKLFIKITDTDDDTLEQESVDNVQQRELDSSDYPSNHQSPVPSDQEDQVTLSDAGSEGSSDGFVVIKKCVEVEVSTKEEDSSSMLQQTVEDTLCQALIETTMHGEAVGNDDPQQELITSNCCMI